MASWFLDQLNEMADRGLIDPSGEIAPLLDHEGDENQLHLRFADGSVVVLTAEPKPGA